MKNSGMFFVCDSKKIKKQFQFILVEGLMASVLVFASVLVEFL